MSFPWSTEDADQPIKLIDVVNTANLVARTPGYRADLQPAFPLMQAVVLAVNSQLSSVVPGSVVATVALDTVFTADANVTNIAILTGLADGLYAFYGTHYVTTTTAATGQHSFTVNIDPDGAGSGSYPIAANPLSITVVGSASGQLITRVYGGTALTWNYVVSAFTTGSASVSVRITIVKLT